MDADQIGQLHGSQNKVTVRGMAYGTCQMCAVRWEVSDRQMYVHSDRGYDMFRCFKSFNAGSLVFVFIDLNSCAEAFPETLPEDDTCASKGCAD